jgi:hypothetical protein
VDAAASTVAGGSGVEAGDSVGAAQALRNRIRVRARNLFIIFSLTILDLFYPIMIRVK